MTKRSLRWKYALAFALFLTVPVALGLILLALHVEERPKPQLPTQIPVDPFYYKSIGKAPDGFDQPKVAGSKEIPINRYTLEVEITTDRKKAVQRIDELSGHGLKAYYTPLQKDGRVVYRVRQGVYGDVASADQAAHTLRDNFGISSEVVRLN